MPVCKNCKSAQVRKNGIVAGKQRYRCKECGLNFREGDKRTNENVAARKALCILLYSMAKGSFRMIGRILGIDHSLVYRWIQEFGYSLPEPNVPNDVKHMELDEMWHFVHSKKEEYGSSKLLTVVQGELWPGFSAIVILKPSNGYTTK